MNIAFVVGISKYERASALPACENDARRMGELLIATGKYDEVLCVQGHNTSANDVKTNLRRLVQRHRGSRIDEAFIYFSGHGTFVGEAYLCCSDFNAACPAGTSLSNGEIDELLRGLAPEVAVKVLDA